MAEDAAVALKPANVSHARAAALSFGGTTALHFFRKAGLGAGNSVLVNGASGAVDTAAIQLAKHFVAEVTPVCSGRNAALVTSLAADHVIDYIKEDFTRNGRAYDVIIDTAGTPPFARSRASLRDGGQLLVVLGGPRGLLRIRGSALTGLVLPLKALDPPEELANLPFAISELPLKLRDLVELLLVLGPVLLAHHTLPAKRVLLIQSAVTDTLRLIARSERLASATLPFGLPSSRASRPLSFLAGYLRSCVPG
jgi:hypothetical protein